MKKQNREQKKKPYLDLNKNGERTTEGSAGNEQPGIQPIHIHRQHCPDNACMSV